MSEQDLVILNQLGLEDWKLFGLTISWIVPVVGVLKVGYDRFDSNRKAPSRYFQLCVNGKQESLRISEKGVWYNHSFKMKNVPKSVEPIEVVLLWLRWNYRKEVLAYEFKKAEA